MTGRPVLERLPVERSLQWQGLPVSELSACISESDLGGILIIFQHDKPKVSSRPRRPSPIIHRVIPPPGTDVSTASDKPWLTLELTFGGELPDRPLPVLAVGATDVSSTQADDRSRH